MFLKTLAIIAVLGTCYAADHAHSSQSIVFYLNDGHKNEKHVDDSEHKAVVTPVITNVVPQVEHIDKEDHKPKERVVVATPKVIFPAATKIASKATVAKEEHKHKKPAVSSQNIHRHDVPAKPPADWIVEHGPVKYEFEYKVEDPHTGDKKSQHEASDGHTVKGVYSLHEADGSIRTVKYAAHKHTGFSAEVKHTTKPVAEHKYHKF